MTRVFDCFMFFNEFEHLRIRLEELYDVVDRFVLVEGDLTHTGHPKPLHFHERRFDEIPKEFMGKIHHVMARLPGHGREPWFGWGREIIQRSRINTALQELDAQEDDIVLSGDVDEIPRLRAIIEYAEMGDQICCLEERNLHYNLNTRLKAPTLDPKICRYRHVREFGVADLRYMHQARPLRAIQDAGWHLSFMGGPDKVIEKMKAYAHYDIREPRMDFFTSRENVEASIRDRKSLFQRDDLQYVENADLEDLPRRIVGNPDHFVNAGWIRKD